MEHSNCVGEQKITTLPFGKFMSKNKHHLLFITLNRLPIKQSEEIVSYRLYSHFIVLIVNTNINGNWLNVFFFLS